MYSSDTPIVTGEAALLTVPSGKDAHAKAINDHLAEHPISRTDWPEFQPTPEQKQKTSALARLKDKVKHYTDLD